MSIEADVRARIQELRMAIIAADEQIAKMEVHLLDLRNRREQLDGDVYDLWCQKDALRRELEAKLRELDE